VRAKSFSPYVWSEGRDRLKQAPEEVQKSPKVILVGHSMGGWAIMSVARELRERAIPVERTVQVDRVGLTPITPSPEM
jgi:pimeloyl-ACP methyl ester carboxylesterase